MLKLKNNDKRSLRKRSQTGATAIEYGLIAALVVLAAIPAFELLGDETNGMYSIIANKIDKAIAVTP
jgi:pilus assembly protein Flp/PilA